MIRTSQKTGKLGKAARALAACLALFGATSAPAAILASGDSGTGRFAVPDSFVFSFENLAGYATGTLNFRIRGFGSLDGDLDGIDHRVTDTFTLLVNSIPVFGGTFNMGGNGDNTVWGPSGMTWRTVSNGFMEGGRTVVSLPISLIQGINTVAFQYETEKFQGKADEAWKVGFYQVTAVPEPETYAMMLAGLGLVSAMARRRRKS